MKLQKSFFFPIKVYLKYQATLTNSPPILTQHTTCNSPCDHEFNNLGEWWTCVYPFNNNHLYTKTAIQLKLLHGHYENYLSHFKIYLHVPCDPEGACEWPPLMWSIRSINTKPQTNESPINTSGSTWEIWCFKRSTCEWTLLVSSREWEASAALSSEWVWEACPLKEKNK